LPRVLGVAAESTGIAVSRNDAIRLPRLHAVEELGQAGVGVVAGVAQPVEGVTMIALVPRT
jgi:hypothetical protein